MDFIYFTVTGSKSWTPDYHANFFITEGGFAWGVAGAVIIAVICAFIFYFGICNKKDSVKGASVTVWGVVLVISGLLGYFYADMILIGERNARDNNGLFRTHSFYKANEDYYIAKTKAGVSPDMAQQLVAKKEEIKTNLNKGKDVRFDFDLTTGLFTVLIYFIVSIIIKRYSRNGRAIPFQNP